MVISIAHYSWYLTIITFVENKLHLKSIVPNIIYEKTPLFLRNVVGFRISQFLLQG